MNELGRTDNHLIITSIRWVVYQRGPAISLFTISCSCGHSSEQLPKSVYKCNYCGHEDTIEQICINTESIYERTEPH